jgi:aminoglycoside phosphotransferase (APT) family kinase protein
MNMNFKNVKSYLADQISCHREEIEITQISGGYSNLTFKVSCPKGNYALRRPPFGEKIAKAHDMNREFRVLESLQKAGYSKSPKPIFYCEDEDVFGSPFFVMEFVEGLIIRNKVPSEYNFTSTHFEKLSQNTVDCLLELHQLELNDSGLIQLGKPEGYVERQVGGWSERYQKAKTNELPQMEQAAVWLQSNLPKPQAPSFLHNDFKYDNLILDSNSLTDIKAVLDWEMATVGNPLMDLGTTLAYWAEETDPPILKLFNLSHMPGNLSRQELVNYYQEKSGINLEDIHFYYAFGLFKVGVIAQQIFKRYREGYAKDPRFAALIQVVEAAGKKAVQALETQKI